MRIAILLVLLFATESQACPDIDNVRDTNCDGRLVIAAFGDSITEGAADERHLGGYPGRLSYFFPSAEIRNLGVGGEYTSVGVIRASQVFGPMTDLDYVIIEEGTNDFVAGLSAKTTIKNLALISASAKAAGAKVIMTDLLDTRYWYRNAKYRAFIRSVNSRLHEDVSINALGREVLSADGLHPDAFGYDCIALAVARVMLGRD